MQATLDHENSCSNKILTVPNLQAVISGFISWMKKYFCFKNLKNNSFLYKFLTTALKRNHGHSPQILTTPTEQTDVLVFMQPFHDICNTWLPFTITGQ